MNKFEGKWRLIGGDLYGHVSFGNIFKALVRYPYGRGHIDTARIVPREARLAPVSQHINVCRSNIVFGRCQPHLAASAERVFLQQANGKSPCRRIVNSKLLIYRSNCTVIIARCRTFRIYPQCNALACELWLLSS